MKNKRNKLVKSNYSDIDYWAKLYAESVKKLNEDILDYDELSDNEITSYVCSILLYFLSGNGNQILNSTVQLSTIAEVYENAIDRGLFTPELDVHRFYKDFLKLIKNKIEKI